MHKSVNLFIKTAFEYKNCKKLHILKFLAEK